MKIPSREDMVQDYIIEEEGLKALVTDLLAKDDDGNNDTILRTALKGRYSDFSKSGAPALMLQEQLKIAKYTDMLNNAKQGKYDHNVPPKPVKKSREELLERQVNVLKSIGELAKGYDAMKDEYEANRASTTSQFNK